ncbi:MAG: tetratricopeptide repeat protein, partial [Candidatus Hydrogenedentales bacterium]
KFDEAIAPAARLVELMPKDVENRSTYGNILLQAGRYGDAIDAYKAVLALDPGHSGDYYNLGLCHFYLEDWDATAAAWLTALAHDPQNASVRKGLAVVYWRRGDFDEAWHAVWECQRRGIPLAADFIEDLQRDSGRTGLDESQEWEVKVGESDATLPQ